MPALHDIPRLSRSGSLELAARRIVEGIYAGRHRSPYTGPAVEFADHRAYLPGDDLRAVDWKAYARSDHLLIRRYREERDLPLLLLLDRSASMDYGQPGKAAWSALAAAVLGLLAIDQGDRVRLAAGAATLDDFGRELGGAPGAAALCRSLDSLPCAGRGDLPALLGALGRRLERRVMIVILSDFLDELEPLAQPLGGLAARGHDLVCIQVLDRSEAALPADWGLSALHDPEGVVPGRAIDAAAVKAGYDAAIQAQREACGRLCAGCRADHVLAITDQDPAQVLGAWLHRRGAR